MVLVPILQYPIIAIARTHPLTGATVWTIMLEIKNKTWNWNWNLSGKSWPRAAAVSIQGIDLL